MLKAIEWKQQKLLVVDQSKLPDKIVKIQCKNPVQIIELIRAGKVQGSGALGILAAFSIYFAVKTPPLVKTFEKLILQIEKICSQMSKVYPTGMSVQWALDRMLRCAQNHRDHKLVTLRDILLREAVAILKDDEKASSVISQTGAEMIRDGDTILVYGNSGSLSSAGKGTALGMVIEASTKRNDLHVLVCEARPRFVGMKQTAVELKQAKISFQLITDNMAAHLMKKGMVDIAVAGAERVAMNGDVVSEMGTYGLAMLAYHHGISFYIASTAANFDKNLLSGEMVPIEERKPTEILTINGKSITASGAKALYPAFDVTPQKYISAIVTELGVVRAPYDQNLRNLFSNLG